MSADESSHPQVICYVKSHSGNRSLRPDDEAYSLVIAPHEAEREPFVTIEANSCAGVCYGLLTFVQLLRQYDLHLPTLTIEDAPSFPVRGVMLDISRDRIPTMDELFRTVNLLASWKINHLQLYTEHSFAYCGHEEVWQGASPLTGEEVRLLDKQCRGLGITLAANQNCFGHMTGWLRHDRYAHIAETNGEWEWGCHPRSGPFSLCPIDPGSIALIEELLGRLLPNFSSGLVNIGCDETFDVGQGRSRQAVAERGIAAVYSEYVTKVASIARRCGFRSMFWADMVLCHPEALDRIPDELIALVWGYEPDTPFGSWCKQLRASGREVWVCPGTSSWRSITGRTYERRSNLRAAAQEGVKSGASGFLVTDWGDMGHRQQWPVSLHALAEAADAAWNADAAASNDPRASSMHAFGALASGVGPWLDELGDLDRELRRTAGKTDAEGKPTPLRNSTCLFTDLHTPLDCEFRCGSLSDWRTVLERLDDLSDRFPTGLNSQVADELQHTLSVARLAAERAITRRQQEGLSSRRRRQLADKLRDIIQEHRRLWLLRSRPGGLEDSCRYYEIIMEELNPDG